MKKKKKRFWGGKSFFLFAHIRKWKAAAFSLYPPPVARLGVFVGVWGWGRSLLWPFAKPKTLHGENSSFYCVRLNVKLIFNVWHFTQIIRPKTWPRGIPADCFFSAPATVELFFLKKSLWVGRGDHPRRQRPSQIWNSLEKVISWSQSHAKLKTSCRLEAV